MKEKPFKFTPLGHRVTIKPDPVDDTTDAGIVLLDVSKKKMCRGTVVATGKHVTTVHKDDRVLYSPFHFDDVTKDLILIDEIDIWGIVK